ncbi:MAG: HAD family hydrolase [Chloroflexota bacterium]|nr:HAD family hydrolase [Chloroflexota bacterium]
MTSIHTDGPIRLVTFDLYDTLVEADPPRWVRFAAATQAAELGGDADTFRTADRVAEDFYTIENGQLPIRDRSPEEIEAFRLAYTSRMLEAAGLPHDLDTARQVREIYVGELDAAGWSYRVFDDVMPALRLLEEKGVKRAVISNADADVTNFCLDMGFSKHMDLIVTSALVGWEKPDSRTYFAALEPVDVAAEDAIHVGDQALSDVVGARAIGMGAAIIDRYERHGDDEHDAIRVTSLLDLADMVVAHNARIGSGVR